MTDEQRYEDWQKAHTPITEQPLDWRPTKVTIDRDGVRREYANTCHDCGKDIPTTITSDTTNDAIAWLGELLSVCDDCWQINVELGNY